MDGSPAVTNGYCAADAASSPLNAFGTADPTTTLVVGVGSPYGDDQVGWRVIEMLQRRLDCPARFLLVHEGSELVASMKGCHRLIVVDACQSGAAVGSISRLRWPDARIADDTRRSMHGVTLSEAFRLAQLLGRMPSIVEVIAIEIDECSPGRDLSPMMLRAAGEVENLIVNELHEEIHA